MNVLTNAFQDGFFVFTNLWTNSGPTFQGGDNAADFLLGLNSLAMHDQTFRGCHYRTPMEDVPPLRAG